MIADGKMAKWVRKRLRRLFWGIGVLMRQARGTRWERRVTQALKQVVAGYNNASFDMRSNGELWLLARLSSLSPTLVLDVGANSGEWSLAVANRCESANVHAFEPVPSTYEHLIKAVGTNPRIQAHPIALGACNGELRLWVPEAETSSAVATAYPIALTGEHQHTQGSWIEVPMRHGSEFLDECDIEVVDLLKVDAEGFDLNVLQGFGDALHRVRVIQFEYAAFAVKPGFFLYHYYDFLSQHGFEVGRLFPNRVHVQPYSLGEESIHGGVFVGFRPEDIEIKRLLNIPLRSVTRSHSGW